MAMAGGTKTAGQTFAMVFGLVYLLVGIAGFFVASEFTGGSTDDKLILFPVNHLHNIVHLAIGALLLAGSRTAAQAKSMNMLVGIVLLLVAVLGFLGLEFMEDLLNIHGSGSADNWLHLATGALALYFGTAGATTATTPTVTP
jgi:zinc transporter ZupT